MRTRCSSSQRTKKQCPQVGGRPSYALIGAVELSVPSYPLGTSSRLQRGFDLSNSGDNIGLSTKGLDSIIMPRSDNVMVGMKGFDFADSRASVGLNTQGLGNISRPQSGVRSKWAFLAAGVCPARPCPSARSHKAPAPSALHSQLHRSRCQPRDGRI